ncbi:hypothetical protein TNIN_471991 [Trichonephila inaurata madagascariensis]|uniref:Uncharacterized protein n=1 Tax=Trichonephila inaurata madagascariensis TaxID=2747483 RepID=A0A8X7CRF6_9ARAC|nr:hypothetical protein TNIN_471991 [Trichonephila inaurata madagascariensis]
MHNHRIKLDVLSPTESKCPLRNGEVLSSGIHFSNPTSLRPSLFQVELEEGRPRLKCKKEVAKKFHLVSDGSHVQRRPQSKSIRKPSRYSTYKGGRKKFLLSSNLPFLPSSSRSLERLLQAEWTDTWVEEARIANPSKASTSSLNTSVPPPGTYWD